RRPSGARLFLRNRNSAQMPGTAGDRRNSPADRIIRGTRLSSIGHCRRCTRSCVQLLSRESQKEFAVSPAFLAVMTFLAGTFAVVAVYSIVTDLLRDRSRIGRRVDDEFRKKQQDRVRKSGLFKDPGAFAAESGADDDVRPANLRQRFETLIEQS